MQFLAEKYAVPINAVFFRSFAEEDRRYLARTWLRESGPSDGTDGARRASRNKRRPWNGRDHYVILGNAGDPVRYEVAREHGYLNAGGGAWYWKPLRNLQSGKRVFAYVGGAGYVGIADVIDEMIPARDAKVNIDGESQALLDQPEVSDDFRERALSDDPEKTEMVVPVKWIKAVQVDQAVPATGLFSSTVTVCKLTSEHTIEAVETALGIDDTG